MHGLARLAASQTENAKPLAPSGTSQIEIANVLARPVTSQIEIAKTLARPDTSQNENAKTLARPGTSQFEIAKTLAGPMKHTYLVLLGVALLLSSCLHISGPEVDENERFSRQVEKDLRARNVHFKEYPFYVMGGWPSSGLRLSICDNHLVPAGRSMFGAEDVNVILEVMVNVSKEQSFPRNIVLRDSFSARDRFVVLARGKGIKTIRPIQCTLNPPSSLPH